MSFPRPTIFRLALAGLTLAAMILMAEKTRRVARYRLARAAELAAEAESWAEDAAVVEGLMAKPGGVDEADNLVRLGEIRDASRGYLRMSRFCRDLADSYERSAYRPWVAMEPEPSPPD